MSNAASGFDFTKEPDSCLGLLDYLQRALEFAWERAESGREQEQNLGPIVFGNRRLLRCPPSDPIKAAEWAIEEERRERESLEQISASERLHYTRLVTAFRAVSQWSIRQLLQTQGLIGPTLPDFALPFFEFQQSHPTGQDARETLDSLKDLAEFWRQLAKHISDAAFTNGELPDDWVPKPIELCFSGSVIDRYPSFPIKSPQDVIKWLDLWRKRSRRPPAPCAQSSPLGMISPPMRLANEESYAAELSDLVRELGNCRHAMATMEVPLGLPWEGDTSDFSVAQDRIIALIDRLHDEDTVRARRQQSLELVEAKVAWNDPTAVRPPDYEFGPLRGKKKELVRWILDADDARRLVAPLENGTYWGQKLGRIDFCVWFKSRQNYADANTRKRAEQQRDTRPT